MLKRFGGKHVKYLGLGLAFVFAMAYSEKGDAVVFPQRGTPGVFGTMTITGALSQTLNLTVTSIASTSALPDGGNLNAVTLTGAQADIVDFGNMSSTCATATNGACYVLTVGGPGSAYVATLNAHLVATGYTVGTGPGLRICRSAYAAGQWPAGQLRVLAANGGTWTSAAGNAAIGDIDTGSCATNGNQLIAANAGQDVNQPFQIAGQVMAADTATPSTTITFESF